MAHIASATVLYVHICAGSIGLISGAAALMARKGSRLHRSTGKLFVLSMLAMSAIGASVAPFLAVPERATGIAGVLTFYLVLTAWNAVIRRSAAVSLFDVGALFVSLGITAASIVFISMASNTASGLIDGQPPQAFFIFLILGATAACGDIRVMLQRSVSGRTRIARHLWRMCAALFIATGSLFLGQQQVFPASARPYLFVPVILVVAIMLFWLGRVGLGATYKSRGVMSTKGLATRLD